MKPAIFTFWSPLLLLAGCLASICGQPSFALAGASPPPQSIPSGGPATQCSPDNGGLDLPPGFCATIFAEEVGRIRHIAVRDNGDLYARLRRPRLGGSIVALRDSNGDGRADMQQLFSDLPGGTGIGWVKNDLYVSTDTAVFRYRFGSGDLVPAAPPQILITGFPSQFQHAAKSFALDAQGFIYVNVGAPSNACQESMRSQGSPGLDPCPQLDRQGGIWRFSTDKLRQSQEKDGARFATGIRNAVAIAWHPGVERLYVVQHGRDQLHELWPDLYSVEQNAELPAEEFMQVKREDDFGWPYCYYDHQQGKKVLAPEYGGDGKKIGRCDQFKGPLLGFPGHWAPNGLMFYTASQFPAAYRGGAFIAFHGSWNRAPLEQQGYKVVFVPLRDGLPGGSWSDFATGFAGAGPIASSGDARYRPMGLAQGVDGSLFIADSVQGRIWRVIFRGADEVSGTAEKTKK